MMSENAVPETVTSPAAEIPASVEPVVAAPIDYSGLKLPEGYTAEDIAVTALRAQAETHKLPLEALQAQIDAVAARDAAAADVFKSQREAWAKELAADKDVGGAKLPENMGHANKWLETYGSPELKQLLTESGLGEHPLLVKALIKAGKDASEAPVIPSNGAANVDPYRVLYPNSPQMFQ